MEHLANVILAICILILIIVAATCIAVSIIRSKVEQIMYVLGIKGTSIEENIRNTLKIKE